MSDQGFTLRVHPQNRCHACNKVLSTPNALLKHLKTIERIEMPSRPPSHSRPTERHITYVKNAEDADEIHASCPSCWFHCSIMEMDVYDQHVQEQHIFRDWETVDPNGETSNFWPDLETTDQMVLYVPNHNNRSAQENEIIDLVDKLAATFRSLFSRSK